MRLLSGIFYSGSRSIFSKRPSGALGVDTMTIHGLLFAMYFSLTSLASCFSPAGKKSASSNKINLGDRQ